MLAGSNATWYSTRTPPLGCCRLRSSAIAAMQSANATGGTNGKMQSLVPGCISGCQHVGRTRNGCGGYTGSAPECRQRAAELADEPPHLCRTALLTARPNQQG